MASSHISSETRVTHFAAIGAESFFRRAGFLARIEIPLLSLGCAESHRHSIVLFEFRSVTPA